ncbi:hypothetical protein IGI53_001055 [Enterococcus sp. DIV0788_1]
MPIELERSLELRKLQLGKNDPNCDHEYDREFFNGIPTGDYACKKCGQSISKSSYIRLMKARGSFN